MTVDERLESCKVTQAEVKGMSTGALIETVVNYPYLINMYAYENIEMGISMVSNHFPGLNELLSRKDALYELQNYVEGASTQNYSEDETIGEIYADTLICTLTRGRESELQASRSTVYTPMETPVSVMLNVGWVEIAAMYSFDTASEASTHASDLQVQYETCYPNAVRLTNYSPSFNCFSYAWYLASTGNVTWMPSCEAYITDGSYYPTNAVAGGRVIYKNGSYITHAGIVNNVSGSNVTVTSKWTYNGLYTHSVNDCPSYVDGARTLQYWAAS